MNFIKFEHSSVFEYPAIELDMTYFMEHLSDKYICIKTEVGNDGVQTDLGINDCKTEDCTDSGEISCVPKIELEQKEKVKKFIVFYDERFW